MATAKETELSQQDTITRDFWIVPTPRRLRYDPARPVQFGLALNIAFGFASTFIVANLYYCQPLLIQMANSFRVDYNKVSQIPTLVQAGYATGLLLISPLGDLVRRRPLMLLLTVLTSTLSIGLALTSSLVVFEVISFLVGVLSVTPQILIPLAADLAPAERRGSAISIVLAGLLLGILAARVLAGIVAQFCSWRIVYHIAYGVQLFVLGGMWGFLPDYPSKNPGTGYFGILYTMARLAVTEPLLVQASLINVASAACFSNFWVTLTFLLGGPPYNYSTLTIGLFGLVGAFGVFTAPFVGRFVDRLVPWHASLIGIIGYIVFQAIQVGAGGVHIAAVVLSCVGLDLFRQLQQVSLTSAVYALDAAARARLNAVLIIAIFLGQVMGTSVGTRVFIHFGWRASAGLSLAWMGFELVILLSRGPHCDRYTWIGWRGGLTPALRSTTKVPKDEEQITTPVYASHEEITAVKNRKEDLVLQRA